MIDNEAALPRTRPPALFIDEQPTVAALAPALMRAFTVLAANEPVAAAQTLRRIKPALVIMNVEVTQGTAVDLCREAKALQQPAGVLALTDTPANAPALLLAGCDGILLKPYAPNLLYARVGRLLRSGRRQDGPPALCPRCSGDGGTRFDVSSRRLGWFACLRCHHVWLAKITG